MLSMHTDKMRYGPDETVRITLRLLNESDRPREYRFTSAQRFDVRAMRDGEQVWQWSHGMYFAQVLTTLIVQPHDSRVFAAQWNQRETGGAKAPGGRYRLEAWIVGTEERASAEIELLGAEAGSAGLEQAAGQEFSEWRRNGYYHLLAYHGYPMFAHLMPRLDLPEERRA